MKCQFCGEICGDRDALQLHQTSSCPAIEEENFVKCEPVNVRVIFRWRKDRNYVGNTVHIVLSDAENQIELISEGNPNRFESEIVSICPGTYSGQAVLGIDILPLDLINISDDTVYADIKIRNDDDNGQLTLVSEAVHNQPLISERNTTNDVTVNYDLNKKNALAKKMAACNKEDFKVEIHASSCIVQLSAASFEYFRNDVIEHIKRCSHYRIYRHDSVRDLSGCLTSEIIGVGSVGQQLSNFFTMNIYQTTCKVMVNGPKFSKFVGNDLPSLTEKLSNRHTTICEVNRQFQSSIPKAMSLLSVSEQVHENGGNLQDEKGTDVVCVSKRKRRRKVFVDFDTDSQVRKKSRVTRSGVRNRTVDVPSVVEEVEDIEEESEWEMQPKYWEKYQNEPWTIDTAKVCNRPKGCLADCGKNNSKDMVMCDGCGMWCHIKCVDTVVNTSDDFICFKCSEMDQISKQVDDLPEVQEKPVQNQLSIVQFVSKEMNMHEEVVYENLAIDVQGESDIIEVSGSNIQESSTQESVKNSTSQVVTKVPICEEVKDLMEELLLKVDNLLNLSMANDSNSLKLSLSREHQTNVLVPQVCNKMSTVECSSGQFRILQLQNSATFLNPRLQNSATVAEFYNHNCASIIMVPSFLIHYDA